MPILVLSLELARKPMRLRDLVLPLTRRGSLMKKDNFLPRCHSHMLGEDGRVDMDQCEALAADMKDLREMGIILTLVGCYRVGNYRYTNLSDALAQARIQREEVRLGAAFIPPQIVGH